MAAQSIWGNTAGANPAYKKGMWGYGDYSSGGQPAAGGIWGGNTGPFKPDAVGTQQAGGTPPGMDWSQYDVSQMPSGSMDSYNTGIMKPPGGGVDPGLLGIPGTGGSSSDSKTTSTTKFEPWGPQGDMLKYLYAQGQKNYQDLTKQGPVGFDPASTEALHRIQQIAQSPNQAVGAANNAVTGIASGDTSLGTGSMFGNLYQQPGITTANKFNSLYANPGITTGGAFGQMADSQAIGTGNFQNLVNQQQPGSGSFDAIYGDTRSPGSLSQGIFGNIASGGQLSAYPKYAPTYDKDGNPIADPRMSGVPQPASDPNPYRSAALQDALTQTANQVKAGVSAAGRYGSSAYGDALGKALGSAATNFNLNAYNSDQDRMMQAAQAASNENLQRQGIGLQAASGSANVQNQGIQNRLNASTALANAQGQNFSDSLAARQAQTGAQAQNWQNQLGAAQGLTGVQGQNAQTQLQAAQGLTGVRQGDINNRLQAAGMADAVSQARYNDAKQEASVGAAREAMKQQQQQFGTQNLQSLAGMFGGLPGSAGTSTTSQPATPWWQQLLGLGVAGAGALGGIFG